MSTRLLHELAHARAGDKGDRSSVCVFVYDARHYDAVAAQLTPQRLKQQFAGLFRGRIVRHELPALGGFNFVMDEAIEGGVNASLNLDSHGKSWSSLILGLTVEVAD
jgi:hypothetical protein